MLSMDMSWKAWIDNQCHITYTVTVDLSFAKG